MNRLGSKVATMFIAAILLLGAAYMMLDGLTGLGKLRGCL